MVVGGPHRDMQKEAEAYLIIFSGGSCKRQLAYETARSAG